jgi:hypothetical protein
MKSRKPFKAPRAYDDRHSKLWVKGVNPMSSPWEEKALAVFQPDILVSAQYLATYRRRFHLQPEQLLMLAVLEDAVLCFQDHLTATQPRKQALYRDAEEWMLHGDKSYFFSFDNICDSIGIDSAYLRRGLMRWKERALREMNRNTARQRLAS